MVILYHIRQHGWLSPSSQYVSNRAEARQFTAEDAIALCKRHADNRGIALVPVHLSDLEKINDAS